MEDYQLELVLLRGQYDALVHGIVCSARTSRQPGEILAQAVARSAYVRIMEAANLCRHAGFDPSETDGEG